MRACFLGQNICNLGYGVATLQAPRLAMDGPVPAAEERIDQGIVIPQGPIGSPPVTIPQRPDA
jgi:hypothetical protein